MALRQRWWQALILSIMLYQIIIHLVWLSPSTQSGQVTVPWLLNRGYTLFDNVIEQRAPLSAVLLAGAQRLLPLEPVDVVRLLNIALVLLLDVLIFRLAWCLGGGAVAGGLALLVWAWWQPVYGNVLFYFDTLLGLMVLAGVLVAVPPLLAGRLTWQRALLTGVCLGIGFLFKQHGAGAAGLLGLALLVVAGPRRLAAFVAGLLLPLLPVVGVIAAQGHLEAYLYWNYIVNLSGGVTPAPIEGDFVRRLLLLNVLALPFALLLLRDAARRPAALVLLLAWAGAWLPLYPHGGDIRVMALLPLTAVMSGVVLARVLPSLRPARDWWPRATPAEITLGGVLALLALVWGFTGLAPQLSAPLGRGAVIAYDEFWPVAEVIRARAQPQDRLFILPQFDGTPQLLVQTGLLPPGTWSNHDGVFLAAQDARLVTTLLAELRAAPPRFVVLFPELTTVRAVRPAIEPLLAFIASAGYVEIARFPDIPFTGAAIVYEKAG
ncbi:MAG: hypothetical protein MUE40_09310 [Anaerolineae bacterium]|jgi:hypothetical protein|nr:hypothetical protein [Anaerolineae bacterium]